MHSPIFVVLLLEGHAQGARATDALLGVRQEGGGGCGGCEAEAAELKAARDTLFHSCEM